MCSLRMPPPGRAWAAPYWASDHGWLEAVEPSPRRRGRRGESPRARGRRGARAPGSGGCDGPAGRSSVSFVIAHPPPTWTSRRLVRAANADGPRPIEQRETIRQACGQGAGHHERAGNRQGHPGQRQHAEPGEEGPAHCLPRVDRPRRQVPRDRRPRGQTEVERWDCRSTLTSGPQWRKSHGNSRLCHETRRHQGRDLCPFPPLCQRPRPAKVEKLARSSGGTSPASSFSRSLVPWERVALGQPRP